MALVFTDALQHDLAEVEAGPGLLQHIRDLALKKKGLKPSDISRKCSSGVHSPQILDSADGLAQLLAAGDDAVDAKFLHLFAAHGIKRHGHRPPQLMVTARASSSVHLLVMVSKMTLLPFSSTSAIGVALIPPMVKVTICSSGEGTAHAVHIHHRHIQPGRRRNGQHAVDAPASMGIKA